MVINNILNKAIELGASDIFIVAGRSVGYKVKGSISEAIPEQRLSPEMTEQLVKEIYTYATYDRFSELYVKGDDDFSLSIPEIGRFRVNCYKQRNSFSAVLRVVSFQIPDAKELCIPPVVLDLAKKQNGLILVCGPAGSGKSTTLACIVDEINRSRHCHIMTLEDPIEYIHRHNKSMVSQREISIDSESYKSALKSVLRQAPDVILIGEMRDLETTNIALTAAETGHLVLSSMHTLGAANTVDRILDLFPSNQQEQVRFQLSMLLQSVVSQQLLPTIEGDRAIAMEVMLATPAIKNLIRTSKTHQIESILQMNANIGMQTMDSSIIKSYKEKKISREVALLHAMNPETITRDLT